MPNFLVQSVETVKTVSQLEFDRFFFKKNDKANHCTTWSVQKKILDRVDVFYMNLPKCKEAINLKTQLTLNDGIIFKDETDKTDSNKLILDQFLDSFPDSKSNEFLGDVLRIRETKGNLLIIYIEERKQWQIIEPNRFKVITEKSNSLNAKYSITGFEIQNEQVIERLMLIDNPNIIFIRCTPSSVLGVPPLMFNEQTSNAVVAECKRQYLISNSGAFTKLLLMAKGETLVDKDKLLDTASKINLSLQDPTKSVTIANQEFSTTEINSVQGNSTFWQDISDGYVHHTASLTGLSASMLVAPKTINRATKEQEYKEMIQYSIQPLNRVLTQIVGRMFDIWQEYAGIGANFEITIQNPKSALDVAIDTAILFELEKNKVITTNELRRLIGLEEYAEEELLERDGVRNQTLKLQPSLSPLPIPIKAN